MKWLLPGLVVCATAQSALLGAVSGSFVRPDLFLLLLLFLSPRLSPEAATVQGFLVGLCQDALSGGPLGLRAFIYSLLGFVAARLSREVYTDKPFAQFWLLLAGTVAAGLLSLALLSFFLGPPTLVPALVWVVAPEALSTAALGFLILWLPRAWGALALR